MLRRAPPGSPPNTLAHARCASALLISLLWPFPCSPSFWALQQTREVPHRRRFDVRGSVQWLQRTDRLHPDRRRVAADHSPPNLATSASLAHGPAPRRNPLQPEVLCGSGPPAFRHLRRRLESLAHAHHASGDLRKIRRGAGTHRRMVLMEADFRQIATFTLCRKHTSRAREWSATPCCL